MLGKEVDFKWTAARNNIIPRLHNREKAATTSQTNVIQREYTARVFVGWLPSAVQRALENVHVESDAN